MVRSLFIFPIVNCMTIMLMKMMISPVMPVIRRMSLDA